MEVRFFSTFVLIIFKLGPVAVPACSFPKLKKSMSPQLHFLWSGRNLGLDNLKFGDLAGILISTSGIIWVLRKFRYGYFLSSFIYNLWWLTSHGVLAYLGFQKSQSRFRLWAIWFWNFLFPYVVLFKHKDCSYISQIPFREGVKNNYFGEVSHEEKSAANGE